MTESEKGLIPHRSDRESVVMAIGLAFNVLVLALGALMMASSITQTFTGNTILFGNTDPVFEFFVGFALVIIAANMMSAHGLTHKKG